ncbi:MAG: hypothetical protein ACRYF4_13250 [Janthinobacterium lividum]
MRRRDCVKLSTLSAPSLLLAQTPQEPESSRLVPAGTDLACETHTLGFSKMLFKISSAANAGGMFIMAQDTLRKGGPYRHLHPAQDEWLYARHWSSDGLRDARFAPP